MKKYICLLLSTILIILSTLSTFYPHNVINSCLFSPDNTTYSESFSPVYANAKTPKWKKKINKIILGKTFRFKVKKTVSSQYVRYRSSKNNVISINTLSGKAKAKKQGKAVIYASVYASTGKPLKTLKCNVKVISDKKSSSAKNTDSVSTAQQNSNKNKAEADSKLETNTYFDQSILPGNTDNSSDNPTSSDSPNIPQLPDNSNNTDYSNNNSNTNNSNNSNSDNNDFGNNNSNNSNNSNTNNNNSNNNSGTEDNSSSVSSPVYSDTPYSIQGYVYDINSKPLSFATINLYEKDTIFAENKTTATEPLDSATTDENGFYCITTKEKNFSLLARKASYFSEVETKLNTNNHGGTVCNFILGKYSASEIYCQFMVKTPDNTPVSGTAVSLYSEEDKLIYKCRTDSEGKVSFCNRYGLFSLSVDYIHNVRFYHNQIDKYKKYYILVDADDILSSGREFDDSKKYPFTFADRKTNYFTQDIILNYSPDVDSLPISINHSDDAFKNITESCSLENNSGSDNPFVYLSFSLVASGGAIIGKGDTSVLYTFEENNPAIDINLSQYSHELFSSSSPKLKDGAYTLIVREFTDEEMLNQINSTCAITIFVENGRCKKTNGTLYEASSITANALFEPLENSDITKLFSYESESVFMLYLVNNKEKILIEKEKAKNIILQNSNFYAQNVFENISPEYTYQVEVEYPYCGVVTATKISDTLYEAMPVTTTSYTKDAVIITKDSYDNLCEKKEIPVLHFEIKDKFDKAVFCYENYLFEKQLYAVLNDEGNYMIDFSSIKNYLATIREGTYYLELTLKDYDTVSSEKITYKYGQFNTFYFYEQLIPEYATTVEGSLLCNGFPLTSSDDNYKTSATILLYDKNHQIVAGKDIPTGSVSYRLQDGLDGVLKDGQYKMVIRGNNFDIYEKYINVCQNKTNTYDVELSFSTPSNLNLLLTNSNGNPSSFQNSSSYLHLYEKSYGLYQKEQWVYTSFYQEFSYTGTITITKTDKSSHEWYNDYPISPGTYFLDICPDYCQPYHEELIFSSDMDLQKSIILNYVNPQNMVKNHLLFSELPDEITLDTSLVAICCDSSGKVTEQIISVGKDFLENGIYLSMPAEKEQKIIIYFHGQRLKMYNITSGKYSGTYTLNL